MKRSVVLEAIAAAKLFIRRAEGALDADRLIGSARDYDLAGPSPANAACKRASMDLTRVLARMRR